MRRRVRKGGLCEKVYLVLAMQIIKNEVFYLLQNTSLRNIMLRMLILSFYQTSISQLFFDQNVREMFSFCLCSKSRKATIDPESKHYNEVRQKLSSDEQVMLQLIYNDLAQRNNEKLLTFENFMLFFGLTGLWGAKLFRQFDQSCHKLITKEQFFYGLSRTAKAPHQEKIKLLFNFFKDQEDNGIKFIDFTKMLYNYSRDELKEILMEDKYMIPALNRTISQNISSMELSQSSGSISSLQNYLKTGKKQKQTIIEVNYQQPQTQDETCFGKNYAKFSQYKDPGTILQVKLNDLTYKVNYCNMITLVKQFAKKIYKSYHIDTKTGIFTFNQFSKWIQSHKKLFQSYYTSFHFDIWSYCDSEPNFLSKIQESFIAKIRINKKVSPIYGMFVEDVLILADSYSDRKYPTKVVCLQGLTMNQVRDSNGYGIQISHRDEYYQKFVLYFKTQAQSLRYLQLFQIYQGDTLHDRYLSHELIGTGKFSIVYRCTCKQSGRSFALKDINTEKLTPQTIATLDNESEIMKILSHPQVVKYQQTIRSKSHIYIIAEYIYGNDLYEYVRKRKSLSQYISAFIIGKVIEATIYLHSIQIIHRDLKPDNIMVMLRQKSQLLSCSSIPTDRSNDEENIQNIKIIDFGLSNHLSELQKSQDNKGIAGTPNYIAPEVILGETPTFKADTFAIGSILYFLLSGKLAFATHSMQYTLLRTAKGEYDIKSGIWESISSQAKDLINQLLQTNPQKRICLEEALNHPWFEVVTKKEIQRKSTKSKPEVVNCSLQQKCEEEIKLQTLNEIHIQQMVQSQFGNRLKGEKI